MKDWRASSFQNRSSEVAQPLLQNTNRSSQQYNLKTFIVESRSNVYVSTKYGPLRYCLIKKNELCCPVNLKCKPVFGNTS